MLIIGPADYECFSLDDQTHHVILKDHIGGFDQLLRSPVLDRLQAQANGRTIKVESEYIVDQHIKRNYPNFDFRFSLPLHKQVLNHFGLYKTHPKLTFDNFLCTFNGSAHVSRKLVVAIVNRMGWFNPKYCSKNFEMSADMLSGHIKDYVGDREKFYWKFFHSNDAFYEQIFTFGHNRFDHKNNIYALEQQITGSFVHLVSDTLATSYYPFYGEKFLYSVVSRGLFVTYGQPYWHHNLEKYYGFKAFTTLFDYAFDLVTNPIDRLFRLVSMLSPFSSLSVSDWHDLYQLESETIDHNYDHYFSNSYLKTLESFG